MLQSCYKIKRTAWKNFVSLQTTALKLSVIMQKKDILCSLSCVYHLKIRNFAPEF